ncbi:MAG: YfiT family bacillithiol transferase [Pyrinomonadaceae bacterium]
MTSTGDLDAIRYPIGRVKIATDVTPDDRAGWIAQIAAAPARLRAALADLSDRQLDRRYREGGWTLRQVAHHLADEHLNAFGYFKKAATEDDPAVNVYVEPLWAETKDAREAPVELSLALLTALHSRWVILLNSLDEKDFARAYVHGRRGRVSLDEGIQLYAWHGRHHTAHITSLRDREGW